MNLTKAKETKTRVCCLYRVSTKGQVDKAENDIPMQKKACHEFAESKGWTIIKEHAELGVSGFKVAAADRDELQEIKREAEKQEFDILLVFMFDRLGRKDNETPFVLKWFVEQGISVWSTVEGEQRFDSNVDDLLNYIRFWQASSESQKTSVRIKTVPFPVSWTVKMKKKQKETQDILSYHTQAAGCSDKARAKASGGRQPIEECGRTGL